MDWEKLGFQPVPRDLHIKEHEEIGRGLYATVHKGTFRKKPVAVKKMHHIFMDAESQELMNNFKIMERFVRAHSLLSSDLSGFVKIIEYITGNRLKSQCW